MALERLEQQASAAHDWAEGTSTSSSSSKHPMTVGQLLFGDLRGVVPSRGTVDSIERLLWVLLPPPGAALGGKAGKGGARYSWECQECQECRGMPGNCPARYFFRTVSQLRIALSAQRCF